MATHRHRTATVLLTAGVLLLGLGAPAEAHTFGKGGKAKQVTKTSSVSVTSGRAVEAPATRYAARPSTTRTATTRVTTRTATTRARLTATTTTSAATTAVRFSPKRVTAPTATVPSVSSVSPSGVSVPRGDLPGWKQVYAEDFGRAVPTGSFPGVYGDKWDAYEDGWKDTSKNGTYMPSKVLSVHDGVLDYSIRTEDGKHMVSAPWVTATKGQTYGRYSVRFRADRLPGYKTAWLLWPDSERWPADGEIDFPEGNLDGTIKGFAHWANPNGGQDAFSSGKTFQDWHTATIEWLPGKVTFILDGTVLGSSTKNVPDTAMHWVLQTETALEGSAPSAAVKGHVLVDWVALWTRA